MVLQIPKNIIITLFVIISLISHSCLKSKKPGIPEDILEILNESGIHKPGLMRVILAFQKPEDSLKLKSAYYLIENLKSNYTIRRSLVDSLDNVIEININDFSDLNSIIKFRDSLEKEHGSLKYKADSIWLDFKNISPEFLVNHIHRSYDSWQNNGWSKDYSFNTFKNNILPYRVANEYIEDYQMHFQEKLYYLVSDENNIRSVVEKINSEINNSFVYDNRQVVNPNVQTIHNIENTKSGNLLDLNIYKIKALRSFGMAAALDYTPFYADSVLGYYSTTVILPNNTRLYLTNQDNNTVPYKKKVAKIYRRIHSSDTNSLFSIKKNNTHTPPFLGNFNYLDVTNEYIDVSDITINCSDTSNYIYLAVFNDKKWRPIDWSTINKTGIVRFENIALGIRYCPVIVNKKEIIPIGEVFTP